MALPAVFVLFILLSLLWFQLHGAPRRVLSALSLSTFPVLYFFNFLYYTDGGSTFFILFAYLMTLYGCHGPSALLGVCSVFFRQTNIVWVAFCAGTLVANRMDEIWRAEHTKKKDDKSPGTQVPLSVSGARRVMRFLFDFLTSPHQLRAVLLVAWPYGGVALLFVAFVLLNDGIVVGDRGSHEACLNFPQLFYFLSFALFFSLPVSLCHHRALRFLQSLRRRPVLYLLLSGLALLLVWKFTLVHRYLLADNRHFPFYVWQRVFQRHAAVRFLLVPVYVLAGWNLLDCLRSRSLFLGLACLACLLASCVPQQLLEFRYFIIPYLMFRLHMPLPSLPRLLLELLLHALVNATTLYLFINNTFHWPNSSDVQRFMW